MCNLCWLMCLLLLLPLLLSAIVFRVSPPLAHPCPLLTWIEDPTPRPAPPPRPPPPPPLPPPCPTPLPWMAGRRTDPTPPPLHAPSLASTQPPIQPPSAREKCLAMDGRIEGKGMGMGRISGAWEWRDCTYGPYGVRVMHDASAIQSGTGRRC